MTRKPSEPTQQLSLRPMGVIRPGRSRMQEDPPLR